jgi:hypothetical protein
MAQLLESSDTNEQSEFVVTPAGCAALSLAQNNDSGGLLLQTDRNCYGGQKRSTN